MLAECGIIPPKYFEHDPTIKNNYNETVAILLARKGVIPPEQWYHNPTIFN